MTGVSFQCQLLVGVPQLDALVRSARDAVVAVLVVPDRPDRALLAIEAGHQHVGNLQTLRSHLSFNPLSTL